MSVLTACQKAAIKLLGGGAMPSSVFSSTEEFNVELRTLANETAIAVAKAHDWRALTALHTLTGDGSETGFALPSDFDRMVLKSAVWSTATNTPLRPVRDLDEWLDFQLTAMAGSPGSWAILGGEFQILPAPGTSELVKFYYVSSALWSSSTGNIAEATADADTFRLAERLITLGVTWRWKQSKGLEYGEHMRNFEMAFSEEAGRDKGARVLHVGPARGGGALAYPGVLG